MGKKRWIPRRYAGQYEQFNEAGTENAAPDGGAAEGA